MERIRGAFNPNMKAGSSPGKPSIGYHHFDWRVPAALTVLIDTEEALRRRRKRRGRRKMGVLLLLMRTDSVAGRGLDP